jgi:hypothetical protein
VKKAKRAEFVAKNFPMYLGFFQVKINFIRDCRTSKVPLEAFYVLNFRLFRSPSLGKAPSSVETPSS